MANKLSRAELASVIQKNDPAFKLTKKWTVEKLEKLVKSFGKKATGTRMKVGIHQPVPKNGVLKEPTIPGKDTKRYVILSAMVKGTTVQEIAKLCSWTKQSAISALRTDIRQECGLAYEVKADGKIYAIIPKGLSL